jgi:hypothetical protein
MKRSAKAVGLAARLALPALRSSEALEETRYQL